MKDKVTTRLSKGKELQILAQNCNHRDKPRVHTECGNA